MNSDKKMDEIKRKKTKKRYAYFLYLFVNGDNL